jgi:hypothetical protein
MGAALEDGNIGQRESARNDGPLAWSSMPAMAHLCLPSLRQQAGKVESGSVEASAMSGSSVKLITVNSRIAWRRRTQADCTSAVKAALVELSGAHSWIGLVYL